MKEILAMTILLLALVACGSGSQKYTNETQSKELNNMVDNRAFEIKSSWASPRFTAAMQQLGNVGLFPNGSNAGNIDISSNPNYFRMENDSVMAFLPYYGERQFGGGYNSPTGIEFEGIPEDLNIKKTEKASYEISFNIKDKKSITDNYTVFIKLFPDLSSTININSSSRSNIQYRGKVRPVEDES